MSSHSGKHGPNRVGIERAISALVTRGVFDESDAARLALVRSLADAVDSDPTNASLWREYRAAEASLRETDDTSTDEFTQLLAALSAEMGDPGTGRAP